MPSVQAPYPRIGSHQNSPARLVSLDSRLGPARGPSSSLDLSALTQPWRVSPLWLSFSYTHRPSFHIDLLDQPAVSTQHNAALYRNTQFHSLLTLIPRLVVLHTCGFSAHVMRLGAILHLLLFSILQLSWVTVSVFDASFCTTG